MKLIIKLLFGLISITLSISACALDLEPVDVPNGLPDRIVGDIGVAVYTSNMHIGTEGTQSLVLPYAFLITSDFLFESMRWVLKHLS
jgi:outer membrane protein